MSRSEEARKKFLTGVNCAQAVFSTFSEKYGVEKGTACKIACGFGGGTARSGNTCGAVNGAVMALSIGTDFGRSREEHIRGKDTAYALVREFMERFAERHGSLACRELLRCDIDTAEGSARAQEGKLVETVCPAFVESAVEVVEKLLERR
jgi:C_GCAxxG_C_C family probable redox protein